jgi:hypothetical protein
MKKTRDNARTVSRQTWWIEFGRWMTGETVGPICVNCADPMPDAPFTGAFECDECRELEAVE